jgi:hypothetical protein
VRFGPRVGPGGPGHPGVRRHRRRGRDPRRRGGPHRQRRPGAHAIGCQIRSVVTQSGSCGAGSGGDAPTTYDPSAGEHPGGDSAGVGGAGVSGTPPAADGPPGTVDPGEDGGDGGGTSTPTGWFNADPPAADPVDQDVVDGAVDTFEDKLDSGWNGVRSGELSDISDMLEDLSGPELDAVTASMSDDELRHWVDELDDARDDPDSPVHDATYTQVPHELFAGDPDDPDEPLVDPSDLNVPVSEGGTGGADGLRFDVLDVVEAADAGDEPGATGGLIVILPSA